MGVRVINRTDKLFKDIDKKMKKKINERASVIHQELLLATPVDTGYARSRWTYKPVGFWTDKIVFENDAPYIWHLNEGSSKQAPRYFIQRVVVRHGKVVGPIVMRRTGDEEE